MILSQVTSKAQEEASQTKDQDCSVSESKANESIDLVEVDVAPPPIDHEALQEASKVEGGELIRIRASSELTRCNQLYYQGIYEEALKGYQRLAEQLDDDKVFANIGYTLQALGRHQEAVAAFNRYLETFIARNHAWKALCFSYYHLKDYENMTRCAREAIQWDIRLNTLDDYSWQQMATAHFLMGDYSTALKAARKATALNEHNPYSKYYEACVITAYVEGAEIDATGLLTEEPSYERALELLSSALELRPDLKEELKKEGYLDAVFELYETRQLSGVTDRSSERLEEE